jgi:hypothetical protein
MRETMSAKSAKLVRKIAQKTVRKEARRIEEAKIAEIWASPLRVRLLFALRVLFRK